MRAGAGRPFCGLNPTLRQDPRTYVVSFAQEDAEAARQQWRRVADQLRPKVLELASLMDAAEADVLAYIAIPTAHRAKLQSTNPLKRHPDRR